MDAADNATAAALAAAVVEMCSALGLPLKGDADVDAMITEKAAQLGAARAAKDFATADALRNELQDAGYVVETTKDGTRVRRTS
jgi:cysteinyl-tRNA synthetase